MVHIKDIDTYLIFLQSIVKVVPNARFSVTPYGTVVCSTNMVVRLFLQTDVAVSDESVAYCLSDISKIISAIKLVKSVEGKSSMDLELDGIFITYRGKCSFKFTQVEYSSIKKDTTELIKTKLNTLCSFDINVGSFKSLMGSRNIVSKDDTSKLYVFSKDDSIMGEITDRSNGYSDSIALPIAKSLIEGSISTPLCVRYINAIHFITLPTNSVRFIYNDHKLINIKSKYTHTVDSSTYIIHMDLYTSTMKR